MCCHVDDFVWGGTKNFENKVIKLLKETFSISLERSETFKYLGLDVCQNDNVITLHQIPYVSELSECNVEKSRRGLLNSSQSDKETQQLRTLAGQLNWTSSQTRPDVSDQACEVSTSIKEATINDLEIAKKNIQKLKNTEVVLQFPSLGNLESLYITCFSDASFANLKSGASQGGFVIFLCGNEKFSSIAWKSRNLKRVVNVHYLQKRLL